MSHPKRPSAPVFRYWRYQAAAERAASAGGGGGSGGDAAAVACKEAEGALALAQLPGDGAAAAAAWLRSRRCDAAAEAVDERGRHGDDAIGVLCDAMARGPRALQIALDLRTFSEGQVLIDRIVDEFGDDVT